MVFNIHPALHMGLQGR